MNIYWVDLKRFIQDKLKIILITTLILGVVLSLGLITLNSSSPSNNVVETQLDRTEDNNSEEDYIPSYFEFFMLFEDGEHFTQAGFLKELFNSNAVYELVENETGIDLKGIRKEAIELGAKEDFLPITIDIDGGTKIMVATVETGNSKNNVEVANLYHDLIINNGFPSLNMYEIYSLTSPTTVEEEALEDQIDEELQTQNKNSMKFYIKNIAFGIITAFFLSTGFFVAKEFFSKKLNYTFSYNTNIPDVFMLFDRTNHDVSLLRTFINRPQKTENKVIVSEGELTEDIYSILNNSVFIEYEKSLGVYSSLSEISADEEVEEIILFIESTKTSREWYNRQVDLSKIFKTPIKIIQVNSI